MSHLSYRCLSYFHLLAILVSFILFFGPHLASRKLKSPASAHQKRKNTKSLASDPILTATTSVHDLIPSSPSDASTHAPISPTTASGPVPSSTTGTSTPFLYRLIDEHDEIEPGDEDMMPRKIRFVDAGEGVARAVGLIRG